MIQTLKPRVQPLKTKSVASLTQATRIRGNSLQKIRREHFKENPLCVGCLERNLYRAATELDHITPLSEGGQEAPHNRQGLCSECHAEKSRAEDRARRGDV